MSCLHRTTLVTTAVITFAEGHSSGRRDRRGLLVARYRSDRYSGRADSWRTRSPRDVRADRGSGRPPGDHARDAETACNESAGDRVERLRTWRDSLTVGCDRWHPRAGWACGGLVVILGSDGIDSSRNPVRVR